MRRISIIQFITIFSLGLLTFMTQSCASSDTSIDNFPSQDAYPGYDLVDARHVSNLALNVRNNSNVAIVVRDLSVTAYTNLSMPKYNRTFVQFEGVEQCCRPNPSLIGATPLMVYKFHFVKPGSTKVKLIARHKGLNLAADSFDSDLVTTININIQ